jgi:hypothetical protein
MKLAVVLCAYIAGIVGLAAIGAHLIENGHGEAGGWIIAACLLFMLGISSEGLKDEP